MAITTREKLRSIAIHLFATKGFVATTIGDIEKAAGLAPRAGGFYRHYPTKMSILESIVDESETTIFDEFKTDLLLPLGDVRAELLLIARMILHIGEKYRPLRILLRSEGQSLPDFSRRLKAINSRLANEYLLPWISEVIQNTEFSNKSPNEMMQIFLEVSFTI